MSLYLYAVVLEPERAARGIHFLKAGALTVAARRVRKAPEVTPEALRAHDKAVRSIEAAAVLPFRFGSVVDELELPEKTLKRALLHVKGCVQMTLRVFGTPLQKVKQKGGPGTRYLDARAERFRLPEAEALLTLLKPLIKDQLVERHDVPPLLGSVYHLVPRRKLARYLAALKQAPLRIETSGPWPPYAFGP